MVRRGPAVFLLLVLAACGGGESAESPAGDGPFAVGLAQLTFVDPSRPTAPSANTPAKDSRTLLTRLYYPAQGTPGPGFTADAPPAGDRGAFPLVVFAHGFQAVAEVYQALYLSWAEAGYVVAAPDFPLSSSRSAPGSPVVADYVNQPADLSFLIDRLLEESDRGNGPLAGLIDPARIGVAGQSLGGMTTMGVAFHSCCIDPRIDAAVPMAGRLAGFPNGEYFVGVDTPLLVIHGDRDDVVPYEDGRAIYDAASPPRFLLTVLGGDHIVPYVAGRNNPQTEPVFRGSLAFFDFYLKGRRGGLSALLATGEIDVASLEADYGTRAPDSANRGGTTTPE